MANKKRLYAATLLLSSVLFQACTDVAADDMSASANQSSDLSTLENNPDQARAYDYCRWAFEQGGKTQTLPDYETMMDRDTTTLSNQAWRAVAYIDSGTRIALNATSQKTCRKTFSKANKSFNKQMKKSLAKHKALAKYEISDDPKIAAVQAKLASLWIDDQAARRVYIGSRTEDKTGAEHWIRRLAGSRTALADHNSTEYMKKILNDYDWIDKKRFGERISMGAWLLVQHADNHVELQQLALARMEPYLATEGVSKQNYAYLWDRVAVNTDKKQRYGTQPTWECTPEGKLTLQPLEDPDNVNTRRAAMGMDTVEQGLAEMSRSVCG